MLSKISRKWTLQSLKDKHCLAKRSAADRLPHPLWRGQVDLDPQQVAQAAFQSAKAYQSKAPRFIEIGEKIDVRGSGRIAASHRSKDAEMDYPLSLKLRGVFPSESRSRGLYP